MDRKKAIVTGGSHGIGRGIVFCLAAAGYDVAFSYRNGMEAAEKVVEALKQEYPEGRFYTLPEKMEEDGGAEAFFHQAVSALGGLDLLVNNAGVTLKDSIFDLKKEDMDYMLMVDFRSYILMTQQAVCYMAGHSIRGNVINITSTRADRAYPKDAVYGGIKAGINRAMESAALDAAPYGIRINNIAPGATMRFTKEELDAHRDTPHGKKIAYLSPRIPLERYGAPEDMGNAVVFLASEKAAYITGATIKIDGGLTLPGMPETAEEAENGWGAEKKERGTFHDV